MWHSLSFAGSRILERVKTRNLSIGGTNKILLSAVGGANCPVVDADEIEMQLIIVQICFFNVTFFFKTPNSIQIANPKTKQTYMQNLFASKHEKDVANRHANPASKFPSRTLSTHLKVSDAN